MRRMALIGKILLVIVVVAVIAFTGYKSMDLALLGWNSVVEYETPYIANLSRGPSTEPIAERVVLIVVDGLRYDASEQMLTLNRLRKEGAGLAVWVGQPSLSLPGWTVISSGAWQEVSGVTTNWYEGSARVDTIFKAARDADLPAVIVGSPGWKELFGDHATEVYAIEEPEAETPSETWTKWDDLTYEKASEVLDTYDRGLILIHFVGTDEYAHRFGGIGKEYLEEVRRVDGHIARLLNQLDFEKDAVLITADHGHIDTGGHGGWEKVVLRVPLVMKGKGIRQGAYSDRTQADIAPTVAALLGLPTPVHSQGRPLLEIIEAPAEVKGHKGINAALQLANFYDAYARALGVQPFTDEVLNKYRASIGKGEEGAIAAFHKELTAKARSARAARIWRERVPRLPIAAVVALVPLLYILAFRRRGAALVLPLLFALLYFMAYNGLFFGRGYSWSLSIFNTEEQIKSFFFSRIVDSALIALVLGVILTVASWKRTALERAERMVSYSFFVWYLLLLQVDLFYWLYNYKFSWYLPNLKLGLKYYLDLLQMYGTGLAAPIILVVGLVLGWGIRRWRRPAVPRVEPARPTPAPPAPTPAEVAPSVEAPEATAAETPAEGAPSVEAPEAPPAEAPAEAAPTEEQPPAESAGVAPEAETPAPESASPGTPAAPAGGSGEQEDAPAEVESGKG